MPTLAVSKKFLFGLLQRDYTREEFDNLCFEFGVELDEVTSEREIFRREHASALKDPAQRAAVEALLAKKSDDELYKIDTPANRYDLLSAEGMAIALRVFTGAMPSPVLRVLPPTLTLTVRKSTRRVRDFVICAVLRDISFTNESYNSFIDFQEKLHGGLARKRTLCSVGTHDLDKVKGPFTYECLPKDKIVFSPLNQNGKVLNCADNGLETFYPKDTGFMQVNSWALGPVGESTASRERRLRNYGEFLGPAGFATPDDVEMLEIAQRGYANHASVSWNDYSRGTRRPAPLKKSDELQMRVFWRQWAEQMTGTPNPNATEGRA